MPKYVLLFFVVFSAAAGVLAQPSRARAEHPDRQPPTAEQKDTPVDPQQRRAAVRAALAQREPKADTTEDPIPTRRQLSAQERQDLRQQLRQPRNDVKKP